MKPEYLLAAAAFLIFLYAGYIIRRKGLLELPSFFIIQALVRREQKCRGVKS
jgi:hypothetical protein